MRPPFTLENDWADLSTEERLHKRQTELAPLMDEFFGWVSQSRPFCQAQIGHCNEYIASNTKTTFRTVLSDGDLVLSNNIAERAMKTLVWLWAA